MTENKKNPIQYTPTSKNTGKYDIYKGGVKLFSGVIKNKKDLAKALSNINHY